MSTRLKFLVDESTGTSVVRYLQQVGYDVLYVGDTMQRANDLDILAWAVGDERILVTNDKGFGELVFRSGQKHTGIILFRLQDESPTKRVQLMQILVDNYSDRLSGNFIVTTEKGIRIRSKR